MVRVFLKIKTEMAGINARVTFLGLEGTVVGSCCQNMREVGDDIKLYNCCMVR